MKTIKLKNILFQKSQINAIAKYINDFKGNKEPFQLVIYTNSREFTYTYGDEDNRNSDFLKIEKELEND